MTEEQAHETPRGMPGRRGRGHGECRPAGASVAGRPSPTVATASDADPAPPPQGHRPDEHPDGDSRTDGARPMVDHLGRRRGRTRRAGDDRPCRLAHRDLRADGTPCLDGDETGADPCRGGTASGRVTGEGSSQACRHLGHDQEYLDHHPGVSRGRRAAGHQLTRSVEWERRAERSGRWCQLPQLERPDRGSLQRPGGADELPGAEHVHRDGPAVSGRSFCAGDHHHRKRHVQRRDLYLQLAGVTGAKPA